MTASTAWRRLLPALLSIALLGGFATEVSAQSKTVTVKVSPTSGNEGDSGLTSVLVTVSRNPYIGAAAARKTDTIRLCYSGGTASHKEDFVVGLAGSTESTVGDGLLDKKGCQFVSLRGERQSQNVKLYVRGDTKIEPAETVIVTPSLVKPPGDWTLTGATYTITNDDEIEVAIKAPTPKKFKEGDSSTTDHNFTVEMTKAHMTSSVGFRVCFSGSASRHAATTAITAGFDYQTLNSGSPSASDCVSGTIAAGATTSTIAGIRVRGDTDVESDETVIATLELTGTPPDGVGLSPSKTTATAKIQNDDGSVVSIAAPADEAEGDSGTTDRIFTVSMTRPAIDPVNYNVCFNDGTAKHKSATNPAPTDYDYESLIGGNPHAFTCVSGTIAIGNTTDTQAGIRVRGDTDAEPDETVIATLTLSSPPSGVTVGTSTATHKILSDEGEVSLSVSSTSGSEGDSGITEATVKVTRSFVSDAVQSVRLCVDQDAAMAATYNTEPARAVNGGDYYLSKLLSSSVSRFDLDGCISVTFGKAAVSSSYKIKVLGDTSVESNEKVVLSLRWATNTAPSGWQFDTSTVTYTIQNDDDAEVSLEAPADANEGNSGNSNRTFTVRLTPMRSDSVSYKVCFDARDPEKTLSPTLATRHAATTAIPAAADYQTLDNNSPSASNCVNGTIAAGDTTSTRVGIRVKGDTEVEPHEAVVATLSLSSPPEGVGVKAGATTVTHRILNDDTPPPPPTPVLRSASPSVITEGETRTFTISDIPASWTGKPRLKLKRGNKLSAYPFNDCSVTSSKLVILRWDVCAEATTSWNSATRVFTFTLKAHRDGDPEEDETFMVQLSDHGGSRGTTESTVTVKNVPPVLTIEAVDNTLTEVNKQDWTSFVSFRINAHPKPTAAYKIDIYIAEEGRVYQHSWAREIGHVTSSSLGAKKVTMSHTGEVEYSVEVQSQTVVERDTKVHALVLSGGRFAFGESSNQATVTVMDGPDEPESVTPLITVSGHAQKVTEGSMAVFSLISEPAPAEDLTVNIMVVDDGDFLASGEEGIKTVIIPKGEPWETVWHEVNLPTVDDAVGEANARVTVRVNPGSGYVVRNAIDLSAGPPYTRGSDSSCVVLLDNDGGPMPMMNGGAVGDGETLTSVKNVRVSDVTATSVTVHWDEVSQAIGYQVELEAQTNGSAPYILAVAGYVGGTSVTINHQASESMTIKARVIPVFIDYQGMIELERGLAGSATFNVTVPETPVGLLSSIGKAQALDGGPGQTVEADPGVVNMVEAMIVRHRDVTGNTGALSKWRKALKTLTQEPGGFTIEELRQQVARLSGMPKQRWQRVLDAVLALQAGHATVAVGATLTSEAGNIVEDYGRKTLHITLDRVLKSGETVTVPLVFGGTASRGHDYLLLATIAPVWVEFANLTGSGTPTLTFSGPSTQYQGKNWGKTARLWIAAQPDDIDEGRGETVTVKIDSNSATDAGVGTKGTGTETFEILESRFEISVNADTAPIIEGAQAQFTVSSSEAPDEDLTVNLIVSETGGADFVSAVDEGAVKVTIPKDETEVSVSVSTTNDENDEPDGTVQVQVAAGTGYVVSLQPQNLASVAVSDNDLPVALPQLSIMDATANEQRQLMYFTVRLSAAAKNSVSVSYNTRESNPVSARSGQDYVASSWSVRFSPGQIQKQFFIPIFNDSHDEDPETFEVHLFNARGATIADGVAVGTIVNSDPMPAAWLSRFGREAAEHALDGIAARLDAPRSQGTQGQVAGYAISFMETADIPAYRFERDIDDDQTPSRIMTGTEALAGSSFTSSGEQDVSGGNLVVWGRAAQSTFDGSEGTFSLDGDATSFMLGADYARDDWLGGFAVIQSTGKGDYRDKEITPRPSSQTCPQGTNGSLCGGAVREGGGKTESTLTAAIPYAAFQASERMKLWAAAGYGSGNVEIKPSVGGSSFKTDINWTMAAMGFRANLLSPQSESSGATVALTSDAMQVSTSSKKSRDLAASDSDVSRLRIGLESSYLIASEDGGRITPKLEIGVRSDSGDAETGVGIELGGGFAWSAPELGIEMNIEGRTLVSHGSDDFKDRGYAASFVYDPRLNTQQGLSLALRHDSGGQSSQGLDALFASNPLNKRSTENEGSKRWTFEAAYGVPGFDGRFIASPNVGLGLYENTRDYSFGLRIAPAKGAPQLTFAVETTRSESDTRSPDHAIEITIRARW